MQVRTRLSAGAAALAILTCGAPVLAQTPPAPAESSAPETGPTAAGGLSTGQLAKMERVSDPRLSPDGPRLL
jgi:hypothetical protein